VASRSTHQYWVLWPTTYGKIQGDGKNALHGICKKRLEHIKLTASYWRLHTSQVCALGMERTLSMIPWPSQSAIALSTWDFQATAAKSEPGHEPLSLGLEVWIGIQAVVDDPVVAQVRSNPESVKSMDFSFKVAHFVTDVAGDFCCCTGSLDGIQGFAGLDWKNLSITTAPFSILQESPSKKRKKWDKGHNCVLPYARLVTTTSLRSRTRSAKNHAVYESINLYVHLQISLLVCVSSFHRLSIFFVQLVHELIALGQDSFQLYRSRLSS